MTTKPLFSPGKHTHTHTLCTLTHLDTHRAVRRKQLKDVIGQMRIMGLQFGLGQGECLAAARQRHAIKTAPLSPPACSAVKLVLSVSLPANVDINKEKPCDSTDAQFGIRGVFFSSFPKNWDIVKHLIMKTALVIIVHQV